jgi:hypothetical protein
VLTVATIRFKTDIGRRLPTSSVYEYALLGSLKVNPID